MCLLFGSRTTTPTLTKAEIQKIVQEEVTKQFNESESMFYGAINDRVEDMHTFVENYTHEVYNEYAAQAEEAAIKAIQEAVEKRMDEIIEKRFADIERKLKVFIMNQLDINYESHHAELQTWFEEGAKETEERLTKHLEYVIKDYERQAESVIYDETFKPLYDNLFVKLYEELTDAINASCVCECKGESDPMYEEMCECFCEKQAKYLGLVASARQLDMLSGEENLVYGDYYRAAQDFVINWMTGDDGSAGEFHEYHIEKGDFLVVSEGFPGDAATNLEESYLRYWTVIKPERK